MAGSRGRGFEIIDIAKQASMDMPHGLPWLVAATRMMESGEEPGLESPSARLRLMEWLDRSTPLQLAWCGMFVAYALQEAIPVARPPLLFMRARPWSTWGEEAPPQLGAILVFWLVHPWSPFGHVGFYWGEDEDSYHVLGGNQRDTMLVERFPKDRLLASRWPEGWEQPEKRRFAMPVEAVAFRDGFR